MKKKTNYEVGHEIPFDGFKVVDMTATRVQALRDAMTEIAESLHEAKEKLFEAIYEKYPELKDYLFYIDHEKKVIRIK